MHHVVVVNKKENEIVSFGLHQQPEADYVLDAIAKYFKMEPPSVHTSNNLIVYGLEVHGVLPAYIFGEVVNEISRSLKIGNLRKKLDIKFVEDGSSMAISPDDKYALKIDIQEALFIAESVVENSSRYIRIDNILPSADGTGDIVERTSEPLESIVIDSGLAHNIHLYTDDSIFAPKDLISENERIKDGLKVQVAYSAEHPVSSSFTFKEDEKVKV